MLALIREAKARAARDLVRRDAFAIALVVLIGGLVIVRAAQIPIVYDESYSIQIAHISRNPFIANNHPLNTVWLSIAWLLPFGDAEIGYRLLSVASFFLFGAAVIRLLQPVRSNVVWGAAVASLLLNPLLIEFWALARGYALATAAVTWILVAIVDQRFDQMPGRFPVTSPVAVWGLIAFYSNFSTLFLVVATWLLASGALGPGVHPRKRFRSLRSLVSVPVLLLIPGVLWLGALSIADRLYYSGSEGLVRDTLQSLVDDTTVGLQLDSTWVADLSLGLAVLICLALITGLAARASAGDLTSGNVAAVLTTTAALWLAAHYLGGAGFPLSRTATFLVVPLVTVIAFSADELLRRPFQAGRPLANGLVRALVAWILAGGLLLIAVGTTISFARWVNTDETVTWRFDRSADVAAALVMSDGAAESQWCGFVTPLQAVEFYVEVMGGEPPKPMCVDDFQGISYWAVNSSEESKPPESAQLVAEFPDAGWDLYRVPAPTLGNGRS